MANGVEETVGLDSLHGAGGVVFDDEVAHETVLTTLDLGSAAVESDSDLGVGQQSGGHGLAGTEDVTSDEDGNVGGVLGEEGGLLGSGVTTADNVEGLVAEDGHGTVADGAGGDTVLPVLVLAGEVHAAG